MESFKRLNDV